MDTFKIFREDTMTHVGDVRRTDRAETFAEANAIAATGTRVSVWRSPAGHNGFALAAHFVGLTVYLHAGYFG